MAAKELIAFSCLLESSAVHRVLLAVKGVSYNVNVAAVEGPNHLDGVGKSGRTTQASARQALMPWVISEGEFTNADALAFGEENSLSRSAVLNFITVLQREGITKRVGPGHYILSAKGKKVGAKLNGHTDPRQGKSAAPRAGRGEKNHTAFVLENIKAGVNTYAGIKEKFRSGGRNPKSIDGAIGHLKKAGLISNSGPGEYKLLAKGLKQLEA